MFVHTKPMGISWFWALMYFEKDKMYDNERRIFSKDFLAVLSSKSLIRFLEMRFFSV